jgi:hypothetical protein
MKEMERWILGGEENSVFIKTYIPRVTFFLRVTLV